MLLRRFLIGEFKEMENNDGVQEIKERLLKIEMLLENVVSTNELKLQGIEEKIKVSNHRINDLEETIKWIWRTVIGAVATGAITVIFTLAQKGAI